MTSIPSLVIPEVRMKDVVAVMDLMRDPNPIHVDEELAKSLGLRGCVNQGPSNLAYVANMLIAWAGAPQAIRHLKLRFHSISCPGDRLEARGTFDQVTVVGDRNIAECNVELVRPLTADEGEGFELIARGTATVEISDELAASIEPVDAPPTCGRQSA